MSNFSNRGSALTIMILAMAMLALFALGALQIYSNLTNDARRSMTSESMESLAQTLSAYVSDSGLCTDGIDGVGGQPGLSFVGPAGNRLNLGIATSANGQDIQMMSNIMTGAPAAPTVLAAGIVLPSFNLRVNRLYLKTSGVVDPTMPATSYPATIYVTATDTMTGVSLGERKVADLSLQVDAANNFVACSGTMGAQQICQNMGCTWVAGSIDQKCQCSLHDMSCGAGQYISGYDPVTLAPTCTSISVSCATPSPWGGGPGYFMAGVDTSGHPICVALAPVPPLVNGACGSANGGSYVNAAATTSAGLCSAGAASVSLVDPGPWNWSCQGAGGGSNANCSAQQMIVGACGPANGGIFASAPIATAAGLCSAGTLSAPIAGASPWAWSCLGANGGANAVCSASSGVPAAPIQILCYRSFSGAPNFWVNIDPPSSGGCGGNAGNNWSNPGVTCATITTASSAAQIAQCTGSGYTTPTLGCPAGPLTWTVGASTCQAAFRAVPVGMQWGNFDIAGPAIGTAVFTCGAGGVWQAAPDPGATCWSPVCPPGAIVQYFGTGPFTGTPGCYCPAATSWNGSACL